MKKILMVLFLSILCAFFAAGCNNNKAEKEFLNEMTNVSSYKAEGVMETFYNNSRKQNEFTVYYKNPDLIKVVIGSVENDEKQIILKNAEGVYVLIPAVNKNFKIKSTWPENASYPYLLQSLAKDIANEENLIKSELEDKYSVETKTKLHADATAVSQKIFFSKDTNLPLEVLVYDDNGDLYIRCVFTKIDLNSNVSDDEFKVDKSMQVIREEYEDGIIYEDREVSLPVYYPEGSTLESQQTSSNQEGTEVRSVMKFGGEVGFTLIQEFINDRDVPVYQEENGDVFMVMGNIGIIKDNTLHVIYRGIEYTLASNDITYDEMFKIVASYMVEEEAK